MGCSYEMNGHFTVRRCPEVEAIVERFNNEMSGGDLHLSTYGETETHSQLILNAYESCPYSTASEMDEMIMEFSPYMDDGAVIYTVCDGDPGNFYVGPPEKESAVRSAIALAQILELLPTLTEEDSRELMNAMTVGQ